MKRGKPSLPADRFVPSNPKHKYLGIRRNDETLSWQFWRPGGHRPPVGSGMARLPPSLQEQCILGMRWMANRSKFPLGKASAIFETKYFLNTNKVHISKKHLGTASLALPLESLSWLFLVVPFSPTKPWKVRKWRYSEGNISWLHIFWYLWAMPGSQWPLKVTVEGSASTVWWE